MLKMSEEQKERNRANHRRNYQNNRAARLEYQRLYRLNMTEEQKENQREHHRRNYARYRGDRIEYQRNFRERPLAQTNGVNVKQD